MAERQISADEKGKKETRSTCKDALEKVDKSDENCPIVPEIMTFNAFSNYMSTRKSKNPGGCLSATSYYGVRSSITHQYRMSGNTMDGELKKELYQFMSGMKRVVAAKSRESGDSIDEGKKEMGFEVYTFFASCH